MVSFSKPSVKEPFCSGVSLSSMRTRTSQALSAVVFSGCPSRFAGGQRTLFGRPSGSGQGHCAVQPGLGVPRGQNAGFGHAGLAVQAPISEHFMHLPASQPLKPQSSMHERFCTSSFASAAQQVCRSLGSQGQGRSSRSSSSKQERVGSQQPPNHSFKRTRLRRSA